MAASGAAPPPDGKDKTKATKAPMVPFAKLFTYADTTDKFMMVLGTIAAFATGTTQPLQIVVFGDTLNAFNPAPPSADVIANATAANATVPMPDPSAMQDSINKVALRFVWLGLGVFVSGLLQVGCWTWTASRQARRLRHAYVKALLSQEMGWFDVNEPMTLATKVADRTFTIQAGMGQKVGEGCNFVSMAVSGIAIGIVKGWKLGLTLLCFTPVLAIAASLMIRSLTSAIQKGIEAYGNAGAVAEESLGNVRTVHGFNLVQVVTDKYASCLRLAEKAGIQKGFAAGWGTGLMFGCMLCTYSFGMYYGTVLVAHDQLGENKCTGDSCYTGGRVMTVFSCIIMGAMGLGQTGPSLQAVFSARTAAYEVFRVIDRASPIDPLATTGTKPANVEGKIELRNVSFHYPSRPDVQVCDNYSLTIEAGQKVAFVGPSGSGKSTIVALLERFYDPIAGTVLLDGRDLKSLHVGWLRQQIALVGQEPVLFAASIAENIGHGKPGATTAEIEQAAKQANAYDFIKGFPDGFATQVGERGLQLSGGQKQRIAIARAILKNPAILLLDEATSALDTESERIVQASLDALLATRKRTTIIIAHRLSTIRDADRILVIDRGHVAEDGAHDELMALPEGRYRQLVLAQESHTKSDNDALNSVDNYATGHDSRSGSKAAWSEGRNNDSGRYDSKKNKIVPVTTGNDAAMNDASMTRRSIVESQPAETKKPKVSKWRIWKMSSPDVIYIVLGALGGSVNGGVFPVWGVLLTKVVVLFYRLDLSADEMKHEGQHWAIYFLILAIVFALAVTMQNYCFGVVSERLTTRMRLAVFRAMLRQEVGWFDLDANSSGALTTRLATDCAVLQAMTTDALGRSLVTLCTVVTAFSIAFSQSWQMTLVLLAIFPLLGTASMIQMKLLNGSNGKKINAGDSKAGALLSETIGGIRTVASFHLEGSVQTRYAEHLAESSGSDQRAGVYGGMGYGFSQCVIFCACGLLFWYGGKLVSKGTITFEKMFMVIITIMFSSMGMGMAGQNAVDSKRANDAAVRVFETIDRVPSIDAGTSDTAKGKRLASVHGTIELRNVRFAYPNRPNTVIYEQYSLIIPSGKTVALVGASGSGKSTVISLIERFYDPLEGTVLLDGHDLKTLDLMWLREHVALVGQEPVLFAGTIADNIGHGKPGATREQILQAAQMANAHGFIEQFPNQYDTSVGDRGAQLSGGQKQRIAIARAILRDPEVLLLDEATSALDNESERLVQASLDALLALKQRTTIIVAHRLSTIRHAHIIAVTDQGRIAEQGTHDELMARPNGLYKALVTRQVTAST